MDEPFARPGEIVELHRADRDLSVHSTATLIKNADFRIAQIHLPAGNEIPTYEAHGQIILHCRFFRRFRGYLVVEKG